jgi:3-phenylpropionate/cinnamic acid dioxygenase small subunit
MSASQTFDRSEATEQIRRLVLTYPEVSDTGDLAGVGRFLDGARMGHFGVPEEEMPIATAEAAADNYGRAVIYYADGLSHAKHLITNFDIVFSPDGQAALSRSNYTVLQARPELPLQVICAGRYEDTVRLVDGRWKLAVRRECMDLKGNLSFHVRDPEHLQATPQVKGAEPAWPEVSAAPAGPATEAPAGAPQRSGFDRAVATENIRRTILTYNELVDRGDFAGVGDLLDGVRIGGANGRRAARIPDTELRSMRAPEIEATYRSSVRLDDSGLPHAKHLVTNLDIRFADDHRMAEARYYYTVLHGTKSSPLQPVISGRYEDEFRSDDERWSLVVRREYVDLVGDLSGYLSPESARSLAPAG